MDFLPTLTPDDWRSLILSIVAGFIVAIALWIWNKSKERLGPLGDTTQIKRTINNLPQPTKHYVQDKQLILKIYRAMKGRKGAAISGLSGMGGIGKTEAAVVAAWHLLKDGKFKDGAVLINLHGFADAERREPMTTKEALSGLIASVSGQITPAEATDQQLIGLWQSVTADKDLLVILDNARNFEQIAPLMPASNGPKVLVTSRNKVQLPDQQEPIEVGKLDAKRANRLAKELAPGLSEEQIRRLINLSLGLPLLLKTIAATVQRKEKTPDAWLTEFEQLGAAAQGADVIELKERLAFSIDALGKDDADRYAALSLCPAGFHAQTAYAIWRMDDTQGADVLRRLREASLLEDDTSPFVELLGPRYVLHDYLADSARERFEKQHWRTRQGYQQRWGQHALELLRGAEALFQTKGGDLAGLRMFEMEQATIRAAQAWAVDKAEDDDTAADLSMRFPNPETLNLRLTPRERIGWLEAGLPAARRLGDREAEAALLGNAGYLYRMLGEFDAAEAGLKASLVIETKIGDRIGMARQHGNLGSLYLDTSDLEKAEGSFNATLEISEALSLAAAKQGDEAAQREADMATANTHGGLGIVYEGQEKYGEAEQSYRASLEITERLGMRQVSANQYGNLGSLYMKQGKLDDAAVAFESGFEIHKDLNDADGMARDNFNLAILRLQQGQIAAAREHAVKARTLYAEVGMDRDVTDTDQLLAEIDKAGG